MRVIAKILVSERSGSSCRATRRERVWQGNMSEKLLTVTEAASTLRLHPVTLRALAAAGTVPGVKIGRVWRFVEVDLLAWARAHYRRADAVGDKESTCRSTNVPIAASGGPRSAYRTEDAYAALVAPRTARKHRNGSIDCAPNSGAFTVSANEQPTRGRTP
jgi:excisionase family DNA binding protein